MCWFGYHSKSGLAPCSGCPMHHYGDKRGTTLCTECPSDRVTLEIGSDNEDDCLGQSWPIYVAGL